MKEKGIIKLIKLLNKYLDDGQERLYACYPLDEDFDKFFHTKDGEGIIEEAQVISKKFGFIKWLVENDKIELKAGPLYGFQPIMSNRQPFTLYETLLMLLSIQDNPIDFLVSILK